MGVSTRASTRTRASWSCNSLSINKRDNLSVSIGFTKARLARFVDDQDHDAMIFVQPMIRTPHIYFTARATALSGSISHTF